MICGSGETQTKMLKEVYHFISAQQRYLKQKTNLNILFINIIDGDESYKRIKDFNKLQNNQIFIGNIYDCLRFFYFGNKSIYKWRQELRSEQINRKS